MPFRLIIIKLLLNLVVCTALQALLVARSCGHVHHRSHHTLPGNLVDAVVPFMGESINDWTLATFLKSMSFLCSHWMHISIVVHAFAESGDRVEVDEPIAQIETDKVTIDVNSPEAGIIQKPRKVILLPLATHVASSDDKVVKMLDNHLLLQILHDQVLQQRRLRNKCLKYPLLYSPNPHLQNLN
ncbi:unnamed protein product [Musa hybrid cultivar]